MTRDAESVAAGLTKAQREAVLSAEVTFAGDLRLYHRHRTTMKSIHKKGLCMEPDWRGCAFATALGAAVRAHLQEKDNG